MKLKLCNIFSDLFFEFVLCLIKRLILIENRLSMMNFLYILG
jgi:hypothetical protein